MQYDVRFLFQSCELRVWLGDPCSWDYKDVTPLPQNETKVQVVAGGDGSEGGQVVEEVKPCQYSEAEGGDTRK